ncbi:MAG: methyltransferase [Gammaproteobacteria bacterium]|nr:methyltransferase [Gammaproteobacteria bacterium]
MPVRFIRQALVAVATAMLLTAPSHAQFGPPYTTDTGKKVFEALSSPIRSDEDRARDAARKPVQTLGYFGLEDDMTVLELFPGRGWYTAILGQVLKDKGQLYVALGISFLGNRLSEWNFDHVKVVGEGTQLERDTSAPGFIFGVEDADFEVTGVDMALTFRNMHNVDEAGRRALNAAAFKALKPGGVYGIVDHTRRHMAPLHYEVWRRADPVQIIKEVLDAGFVFEGWSDLHARPDDELRYDTARPSIAGNSDRFTFKFRKPE